MKEPQECSSIDEVRQQIDALDSQIIELYGKRFLYVKEVVKYKNTDKDSIIAAERRNQVLQSRAELAARHGLNPDVFKQIYTILIDHFIDEELKLIRTEE